jgi:hypothetical protein
VRFIALVLACALGTARANPTKNPQAVLDEGRVAYERGQYGQAVQVIHPLLYPNIELGNEESVVEAHRLLALSYLFMTKSGEAEQEATSLLAMRPDYEPDPVVDPPAAVAFFHSIKKKHEDELRRLQQQQLEEQERLRKDEERRREAARARAERVWVQPVIERHHRIIGFIPFGAGQFQNHHLGWGIGFAVSESLIGAAWIGLTIAIDQKYPHGVVPIGQHDEANTLANVQLGTAVAFWAVVAWGIIDAQVRFVPEHVVGGHELPPGKPPQPKLKASLTPLVAPGLYGLGFQGAW